MNRRDSTDSSWIVTGLAVPLCALVCCASIATPGAARTQGQDPSTPAVQTIVIPRPTQPALAAIRELRHVLARRDAEGIKRALERVAANPGAEFFGLEAVVGSMQFAEGNHDKPLLLEFAKSYDEMHPLVRAILRRESWSDLGELDDRSISDVRFMRGQNFHEFVPALEERSRLAAVHGWDRVEGDLSTDAESCMRVYGDSPPDAGLVAQWTHGIEVAISVGTTPEKFLHRFQGLIPIASADQRCWMASGLGRALPSSLPELLRLANESELRVRRAALEVLCSAVPPWGWTEPRMIRPYHEEGARALQGDQGGPSPWTRLRGEIERLGMPTLAAALESEDEATRILGYRIMIKSGLRNPKIDRSLWDSVIGESPMAATWRQLARDGCALTHEAIFNRLVPRDAQPLVLPTDTAASDRLRAKLRWISSSSDWLPHERMEAAEDLAKYIPRPFAADSDSRFLDQPLGAVQRFMAEAAIDRLAELMHNCYSGAPYAPSVEAELLRLQDLSVPVVAGEWLLAQSWFEHYPRNVWEGYAPLLSALGPSGQAVLAIGADVQWQWSADVCCSSSESALLVVPCLSGVWRTHILPEHRWEAQESIWDDWSNPLDPSFSSPPSWIAQIMRAAGPSAAPFMRPGLDDALAIIRMRSCAAFEYMGVADQSTTNRIAALLDDHDLWVRFFAAKALRALAGEHTELEARAENLLRNY